MDTFQIVVPALLLLCFNADSYFGLPLDSDNQNLDLIHQREQLVKEPKKYCGPALRDMLSTICATYPSLSTSTYRLKASRGGSRITIECCKNACSLEHLSKYCATTSKPLWSVVQITTPRSQQAPPYPSKSSANLNAILKDRSTTSDNTRSNSESEFDFESEMGHLHHKQKVRHPCLIHLHLQHPHNHRLNVTSDSTTLTTQKHIPRHHQLGITSKTKRCQRKICWMGKCCCKKRKTKVYSTTTTTRIPPRFGTVPEDEQENRPFRPSHYHI